MSGDPALAYFHEIVEPTVAEFLAESSDKRRGCLAVLALASMTEHFFHSRPELGANKPDLDRFKGAIRDHAKPGGNAAVGWIADVANATKHVHTLGSRPGYAQVNSLEMGEADVLSADWPMEGREVLVGELPSPSWRLPELVKCTMNFWRGRLELPKPQDTAVNE